MQHIIIEKVSENMASATVGRWFAAEGDRVKRGGLVVELITEKATFELESDDDAVLLKIFAKSKSVLPVGYTVCVLGQEDEQVPGEIDTRNRELLSTAAIDVDASGVEVDRRRPRVKATPAARRKARANGLDLAEIKGVLGIEGVVTEKHIDAFLEANP